MLLATSPLARLALKVKSDNGWVSHRGQGLARQMIYEGLDSLNEFGYAAVVTLGDPALYGRFGFERAAQYDLRCRWPGTEEAFMVHPLADDALKGVHGLVEYSDHFNRF